MDIINALVLNEINPLSKHRMDLVLELKVTWTSQLILIIIVNYHYHYRTGSLTFINNTCAAINENLSQSGFEMLWIEKPIRVLHDLEVIFGLFQDNASKLLLAIMESRHDGENASRILYNMSPNQLVSDWMSRFHLVRWISSTWSFLPVHAPER